MTFCPRFPIQPFFERLLIGIRSLRSKIRDDLRVYVARELYDQLKILSADGIFLNDDLNSEKGYLEVLQLLR